MSHSHVIEPSGRDGNNFPQYFLPDDSATSRNECEANTQLSFLTMYVVWIKVVFLELPDLASKHVSIDSSRGLLNIVLVNTAYIAVNGKMY